MSAVPPILFNLKVSCMTSIKTIRQKIMSSLRVRMSLLRLLQLSPHLLKFMRMPQWKTGFYCQLVAQLGFGMLSCASICFVTFMPVPYLSWLSKYFGVERKLLVINSFAGSIHGFKNAQLPNNESFFGRTKKTQTLQWTRLSNLSLLVTPQLYKMLI